VKPLPCYIYILLVLDFCITKLNYPSGFREDNPPVGSWFLLRGSWLSLVLLGSIEAVG
jgi:hypothetical protein